MAGLGGIRRRNGAAPHLFIQNRTVASTVGPNHGSNNQKLCGVSGSSTTWPGTPAACILTIISSRPTEKRACPLPTNRIGGVFAFT